MNTTRIFAALLVAFCAAAGAQDRPPSIPVPKPVPPRPVGIPVPKPTPVITIPADRIDFSPAYRYADRGDERTLQQATAHADAGDARTLDTATQRIAALDERISAGIAQASALQPLDPVTSGQTTINLGAATYNSQHALGIVMAHQSGRTTFTAGAATSGSGRSLVRLSMGWRF